MSGSTLKQSMQLVVQSDDIVTAPVGGVAVLSLRASVSDGIGHAAGVGVLIARLLRSGVLSVQAVHVACGSQIGDLAMENLQSFLKMIELGKVGEKFLVIKHAEEHDVLVMNICRVLTADNPIAETPDEIMSREA